MTAEIVPDQNAAYEYNGIMDELKVLNTKIDGMLTIVSAAHDQIMPMVTEISDNPAAFMRSLLIGKKSKS